MEKLSPLRSEDDSKKGGSECCEHRVEHEMPKPEPSRVRNAIRELHRLHGRAPLLRDIEREERGVDSLRASQLAKHYIKATNTYHSSTEEGHPLERHERSCRDTGEVLVVG